MRNGKLGGKGHTMLLGFCNIMVDMGCGDLELEGYPSLGVNTHVYIERLDANGASTIESSILVSTSQITV